MSLYGHGATAREEEIEDLAAAGRKPAEIAADLGVGENYVRVVLKRLNGSWAENKAFDDMSRAGTQALARRIAIVGGRFL